jgi:ISXO2-like transposase domain
MNFREETLKTIFEREIENKVLICSKCGSKAVLYGTREYYQRCTWGVCGKRESYLINTPFYYSKITVKKILQILWLWNENVRRKTISKIVEVSKKTVTSIVKRTKNKLIENFWKNFEKIGGEKIVVEIDESKFGLRKYHKGHCVEGVWVFGLVEKTEARRICLIPVDFRNRETLEELLIRYVHKDSIIHSDCWKAYNHIKEYFSEHKTVNHSKFFKDPLTSVHTNTIEGNWSVIKERIHKTKRTKNILKLILLSL